MSATAPERAGATLGLRLFGSFELCRAGESLPRVRQRYGHWLLALLALRPSQEVERSWLAGTLWPESSGPLAYHSLRNSLAALRHCLGPDAGRLHAPTPHTLCLDLTGVAVDVLAFDAAIARGDLHSLEEAVALYRGPLLEGCLEAWALAERQPREQAYVAARERLAALALERGEISLAEQHLQRAAAVDPVQESTQRALMQVRAAGGNYAAALLGYRELRLYLHRELNTEPDAETRTLFDQLRREARRLAAKGGTEAPGRPGTVNVSLRLLAPHPLTPSPPHPFTPSPSELPAAVLREALTRAPMVGREAEWAALERRLVAAQQGRGGICLLAGEPGIGKSRLATEAGTLARMKMDFRLMVGRCDEDGAAPYQSFAEALRAYLDQASPEQVAAVLPPPVAAELVRLVPRLAEKVDDLPTAGTGSGPALVEAIGEFFARLTAAEGPVLLVLEDLHWADEGSLAMLRALARRAPGLPLLIVGTYRDLPPDLQRPLAQTLEALHRERLTERLLLRRLSEAGVGQMVAALLDEALTPTALVSTLHQETEGNPFFIEEVLQHLVEEGALSRRAGRWQIEAPAELQVPPSVQTAIGRRLERLAAESREALRLAAVIGPQFDFEVLLQASAVEEERLLEWVEEWLAARLVIEEASQASGGGGWIRGVRAGPTRASLTPNTFHLTPSGERYQFQHALIRAVLYGGISQQRQGRLHERVGLALEAVRRREEPLEELAHHFARSRSDAAREKGVRYCLRAGERAQRLSAEAEAIQHTQRALRLLDDLPDDEGHWKQRWQATSGLAWAHRTRLEWERARQALEEYRARAVRAGCAWGVAVAHRGLAWHIFSEIELRRGGEIEWARRHAQTSLSLCEQEGLADLLPGACSDLAWFLMSEPGSDFPRAEALLRQALDHREGLPPAQVEWAYGRLTRAYARLGKWDEMMATLRESIALGGAHGIQVIGLNQMEEALDALGRQADFIAFCDETRRPRAQCGAAGPLAQWYLAPARPSGAFVQVAFQDDFDGPPLRAEWQWCDPLQVSAYTLVERVGCLTLRAGDGTDLAPAGGFNAPRLLREVRGEFALEARMEGDWDERSQTGSSGLLVWKDPRNFLRLEKFCMDVYHYGSVQLESMIQGVHHIVGRGLLRGSAFQLRLERVGESITALCRTDETDWMICGQVEFPAPDPLLVGVASLRGMVAHFDGVRVLTQP